MDSIRAFLTKSHCKRIFATYFLWRIVARRNDLSRHRRDLHISKLSVFREVHKCNL